MKNYILYALLIIPTLSFSQDVKQEIEGSKKIQQTFGNNSEIKNIKNEGDRIANININNEKKIEITPVTVLNNNMINKINTLLIPKKIGFSELRYNKEENTFTMVNHSKKIKKSYKLNISKNNYNHLNIENTYNVTKNTNNGTIKKVSGAYMPNAISETYRVEDYSIDGNVYNGDISVSETYFYSPDNSRSYSFGFTFEK